ncbi:hypothetical protein OH76DRAFT_932483 [Lentinus brumalis]|uniref:Uncharacterized protein n=1 Tax=Lentinus brumalis TaxID=2498619 RepID=A0A371CZQ2_9APHY|nr:hypothetical protein OH76DRAFT_932483 [Polyporus brumalis]
MHSVQTGQAGVDEGVRDRQTSDRAPFLLPLMAIRRARRPCSGRVKTAFARAVSLLSALALPWLSLGSPAPLCCPSSALQLASPLQPLSTPLSTAYTRARPETRPRSSARASERTWRQASACSIHQSYYKHPTRVSNALMNLRVVNGERIARNTISKTPPFCSNAQDSPRAACTTLSTKLPSNPLTTESAVQTTTPTP